MPPALCSGGHATVDSPISRPARPPVWRPVAGVIAVEYVNSGGKQASAVLTELCLELEGATVGRANGRGFAGIPEFGLGGGRVSMLRVGVDVGGTFTDIFVHDQASG